MAVVLFTIRKKQHRTFTVAADSPQIRFHIPESEIAQFYSETLHETCRGCPDQIKQRKLRSSKCLSEIDTSSTKCKTYSLS